MVLVDCHAAVIGSLQNNLLDQLQFGIPFLESAVEIKSEEMIAPLDGSLHHALRGGFWAQGLAFANHCEDRLHSLNLIYTSRINSGREDNRGGEY
jgi:hypothetical protein